MAAAAFAHDKLVAWADDCPVIKADGPEETRTGKFEVFQVVPMPDEPHSVDVMKSHFVLDDSLVKSAASRHASCLGMSPLHLLRFSRIVCLSLR